MKPNKLQLFQKETPVVRGKLVSPPPPAEYHRWKMQKEGIDLPEDDGVDIRFLLENSTDTLLTLKR